MSKNVTSLGILPGYKNTTLYAAANGIVVAALIIENIKLFSQLADSIQALCSMAKIKKHDIQLIALLAGPAPLTTTRTLCAWIQGLMRTNKNISAVVLSGLENILKSLHQDSSQHAILLLQAYGGFVHLYDTNEKSEQQISTAEALTKLSNASPDTKIYMGCGLHQLALTCTENCSMTEVYSYDPSFFASESYRCFNEQKNVFTEPRSIQPCQK